MLNYFNSTQLKKDNNYERMKKGVNYTDSNTTSNRNTVGEKSAERIKLLAAHGSEIDSQTNLDSFQGAPFTQKNLIVSHRYLMQITLILAINSAHFGAALSASGTCVDAIKYQLNWSKDQWDNYTTILSSMSIAGLGCGSVLGPMFIGNGRKRVVLFANVIGIISCVMSIINNTYVMFAGRFVYGFVAGVMVVASPKILNEIIPSHVMDNGYGISTNLAINLYVLISMVMGVGMPESPDELKTTNYWKVIYLGPVIAHILGMALLFAFHKEDSLHYHIMKGEKDIAIDMISKTYPKYDKEIHELVYNDLY